MSIRRYTIIPPFATQPGDTFAIRDGLIEQIRGGAAIASRVIAEMDSEPVHSPVVIGSTPVHTLFLETRSVKTLVINNVVHNGDGTKTIYYDGSSSLESITTETLDGWADPNEPGEILMKFMAARWKLSSPNYASSTAITGKVFQYAPELEIGPWLNVANVE